MRDRPLRMLSLCSGIGGLDLAAQWAGVEVVGQVEIDDYCCAVLAKHWPHVKRLRDLREVRGDEFGPFDILAGGIPCQGNSVAGKRLGAADARNLWPDFRRILASLRDRHAQPRWVVVENVDGLRSVDVGSRERPSGLLGEILTDLAALGYRAGWGVWGARDVGAPHRRERIFICGRLANASGERRWEIANGAYGDEGADEGRTSPFHHQPSGEGQGAALVAVADPARGCRADGARFVDAQGALERARIGANGGVEPGPLAARVRERGGVDPAGAQRMAGVGLADPCGAGLSLRVGFTRDDGAQQPPAQRGGDGHHQRGVCLADAASDGRAPQRAESARHVGAPGAGWPDWRDAQSCLGREPDGLPAWLDGSAGRRGSAWHGWPAGPQEAQYEWERPRIASGRTPHRADRLKALGDAVVPQQAYPLFAAIVAADKEE